MTANLPPAVAAYLAASNTRDIDTVVACFTEDAVVHDEGHERKGPSAIKSWREETHEKYQATTEVVGVSESAGKTVVKGLVSGNFPGSPVELGFTFTLAGEKIASLEIR